VKPSRRKFTLLVGSALLATSLPGCRRALRYWRNRAVRTSPNAPRSAPAPSPRLGINLSGADDWNSELPFVDVFRLARPWSSQQEGAAYAAGPALGLDEHGWVKSLPAGAWAESVMCGAPRPPIGEWTVFYEGKGRIEMWAPVIREQTTRGPGHLTFLVSPGENDGFFLRLRETDPSDPVRNIRVIMPGHASSYREEPYNPRFLARWKGVASLRYMDLMKTNDSPQRAWADRPRPDHATWAERGLPVEVLVDIANHLGADPWFTLPHMADDDYFANFAEQVRAKLNRDRKVYIEYSNEVWNNMFAQTRFAREQGAAEGVGGTGDEHALRFYARRSVQIFAAFERVFGGRERLVRVLATQAGNPDGSAQVVGFEGAGESADVLAIAPYLGFNVSQDAEAPTTKTVRGYDLDKLFSVLGAEVFAQSVQQMRTHKALADTFGLALVAYEGGQHLVGIMGGENDEQVTALFIRANRDPRMGALYARYFEAWQAEGGSLFCPFTSVQRSSKWGSWGLLEHDTDTPEEAPKFQATRAWAAKLGQRIGA